MPDNTENKDDSKIDAQPIDNVDPLSVADNATKALSKGAASSMPISLVLLIASVIKGVSDSASYEVTGEKDTGVGIGILLLFILFLIVGIILSPAISVVNLVAKPIVAVEKMLEKKEEPKPFYYVAKEEKDDFFETYAKSLIDISNEYSNATYSNELISQRTLNEETIAVYKCIIDWAIYKSFSSYVFDIFTSLETYKNFFINGYSPIKTYEKFLDNPYPYRLKEDGKDFMTIREFLSLSFDEIQGIENFNNDLNYAEIFSCICESNDFNYDTFSYSDFYDLLTDKKTARLLFEIEISDSPTYYLLPEDADTYEDEIDYESLEPILEEDINDENRDRIITSFDVKAMPYGLEELFLLSNLEMDSYNNVFTTMKNYELLDLKEDWLRSTCPSIFLGPSFKEPRSYKSVSYEAQKSLSIEEPTGRSAKCYLDNSILLTNNYAPEWNQEGSIWCPTNFNLEKDTVLLPMYRYLNQGDYKNVKRGRPPVSGPDTRKTVAYEGCIDMCYIMAYEYFYKTSLNIRKICELYVNPNREFEYGSFCSNYGISYSQKQTTINLRKIESDLRAGYPIVLHMYGLWKGKDGTVYHADKNADHYILLVGFNESGFYVMDPASYENTNKRVIPVSDLAYINDLSYRTLYKGN